ncbi:NAD-dependent epimerase/dehydratase family protein [Pseudonocardiaceae bacterium YIM PH 21723]|nr:NAD-dependent epimerase/dehydratase family protein [Pseudonocardiaceae bacterium YIM PH 21723]
MTILVTGATGTIGRRVVQLLAGLGEPVRAITRRPETAGLPDGVDVRRGDLAEAAGLAEAFAGVDRLYLYPDGDTAGLLDLAERAGVRKVVTLSSFAAGQPLNTAGRLHRRTEEAVEAAGLPWTHLRPGKFAGNLLDWAADIRADGVAREPYPGVRREPVHPMDIADLAVAALTEDGHEGKALPLTGPQSFSKPEMAAVIGQVIGRDVRFEEISEQEFRDRRPGRYFDAQMTAILRMWLEGAADPTAFVYDAPRGTRTLAQWVTENAEAFR